MTLAKKTRIDCRGSLAFLITASLLSSSQSSATGPTELRFRFSPNGIPSEHVFQLYWTDQGANLQSINVLNATTEEIIQQLPLPTGDIDLKFKNVEGSREKFLESTDYDFDGFADLRLLRRVPYKPGDKSYLIFLYDSKSGTYIINEAMSAIKGLLVDRVEKRLIATTLTGKAGAEFQRDFYQLSEKKELLIVERHIQTVVDEANHTYELDVRQRVKGELQRVCVITVPTEGPRKIKWGVRRRCEPYLKIKV